jgi:hypothetical protein
MESIATLDNVELGILGGVSDVAEIREIICGRATLIILNEHLNRRRIVSGLQPARLKIARTRGKVAPASLTETFTAHIKYQLYINARILLRVY